jgi:hypothetical protein
MTFNSEFVMEKSELHIYSMGIVAANKEMSSNVIMVTPHEHLNMLDGDIASNPTPQMASGVDANGKSYSVNVTTNNAIKAEWLNTAGDNRTTSPDVRRGEMVKIWRYGDADKYYWTSTAQDLNLRKLETVRHSFSGTADESMDSTKEGQCYYHEVSTHNGTVTMQTSKANGEVAAYTVQIDAKGGFVHIQDDMGNVFEVDSKNHRISMENADGTVVQIDGKNINETCKGTITKTATDAINMTAMSIKFTAPNVEVDASSGFKVNSPAIDLNGAVSTKGLNNTGDIGNSGSINSTGDVSAPNLD